MPLSWNEIRKRAIAFSYEWKDETRERAEAQTFWNAFFNVFGRERRVVALFEKNVRKLGNKKGSIDLFWEGMLVVEHKSEGASLDKAYNQALDYSGGLRDEQLPKYVIVSDFRQFRLYDIENNKQYEFKLEELVNKIYLFEFMRGGEERSYEEEDPVNIKAAELMGRLHDSLKENGYVGHPLEVLLVRLMFCLFADDTDIFEKDQFTRYIETKTKKDGSDVGLHLNAIFQTLNKTEEERQKNLDEELKAFPYINGSLFKERFEDPSLDSDGRKILLECCHFDWSRVSPAIFGSLFQSVMNPEERRDLGAHYTSEENILKTVRALFLDDLRHEFELHKHNKRHLQEMLMRIGKMKFLDPACGCGNFLIIAYRELRRLQIEIHKQLRKLEGQLGQRVLDIKFDYDLNVDAMYGIEILEFPARIAEVALWLVDHQMNVELSKELGKYYVRLPLETSPNIINGNALRLNWKDIVPPEELSYILGNPPYVGKHLRSTLQNEDMDYVFSNKIRSYKSLDYVASWYIKAQEYIQNTDIEVAFVSTNSITQGEQVGILWGYLLDKGIRINFAHRTFDWSNQAKANAAVYVVIIGFGNFDRKKKYLYNYEDPLFDPVVVAVKNINPYLVEGEDIVITSRKNPICNVPDMLYGCKPVDDGLLILSDEEKEEYIQKESDGAKYIRPFASAKEFLHNKKRWCFWLVDIPPAELKHLPILKKRIEKVREFRLASKKEATRTIAETPTLFGEIRQPDSGTYILIPRHSSEHRKYVPFAIFSYNHIVADSCSIVQNATLYHFGVLQSAMHMAWMRHVCGRLESRYRYSNVLVYNNFPWPENPTEKQIEEVEVCVKDLLAVRESFADTSLADLYDQPMPKKLLDAHKKLDRAVERCYQSKAFKTDLERLQFLFELYGKYCAE